MISMEIAADIRLTTDGLSEKVQQNITDDLTMDNPDYKQALKYGKSTWGKSPTITMYEYADGRLILPRGYGRRLQKQLLDDGVPCKVIDNRLTFPRVSYGDLNVKLRPYQEAAVKALVRRRQGGIVSPCGSGKTIIGLATLARIGQPALWVTHTKELAEQTLESACKVLGMAPDEIGFIGNGQNRPSERLTIALVQTLAKMETSILEGKYGAVFVDEAHHLPAKSFFDVVSLFPAHYRLWASATPTRADGKTPMIYAVAGGVVHTIKQSEVPTIIPRLEVVETEYNGHYTDWQPLMADLIADTTRNTLITNTIAANSHGHYSLVLSERREHLHTLRSMLAKRLPKACIEILTGDMSKRERNDIMDRARARKVDILMAVNIAKEGLDIPHLDRLYIAGALKAEATVQQEVGRVMRPTEGKTDAVVYDFHDAHSPILNAQFKRRRKVYKSLGMQTKEMVTVR